MKDYVFEVEYNGVVNKLSTMAKNENEAIEKITKVVKMKEAIIYLPPKIRE